MANISFSDKQSTESLSDLKRERLKVLTSPMDCYWQQALIGLSDHFLIKNDDQPIGYLCIDNKNHLMDFYLTDSFRSNALNILKAAIKNFSVKNGYAGTNDAAFLSASLSHASQSSLYTLLFKAPGTVGQDDQRNSHNQYRLNQYRLTKANEQDFENAMIVYVESNDQVDQESVDGVYGSMKGYAEDLIQNGQLFLMRSETGEVVGLGERRISESQTPFADVGMIVHKDHRRKGIGTEILRQLNELCQKENLIAICSCEITNPGSHKAITNAGFLHTESIFSFDFDLD